MTKTILFNWLTVAAGLALWAHSASAGVSFSCQENSGIWALKALYLCQVEPRFGACGSLAGHLAGRSLPEERSRAALALIEKARHTNLSIPETQVLASVQAMVHGVFERQWEEELRGLVLLAGPAKVLEVAVKGLSLAEKLSGGPGCQEIDHHAINADPLRNCEADPALISNAVISFLNSADEERRKLLSRPRVCNHYRTRLHDQLHSGYAGTFTCTKSAAGGGQIQSMIKDARSTITRILDFNERGELIKIDLSFSTQPNYEWVVHLEREQVVSVTQSPVNEAVVRAGKRATRLSPDSAWPVGSPFWRSRHVYNELARLKLETSELIDCCSTSSTLHSKLCRMELSGLKDSSAAP